MAHAALLLVLGLVQILLGAAQVAVADQAWLQFVASDPSRQFPIVGGAVGGSTQVYQMNLWSTMYQTSQNPVLSIGTYSGWTSIANPACASGQQLLNQTYSNGANAALCLTPNGNRFSTITWSCGYPGTNTSYISPIIYEQPACHYIFHIQIDCSGNPVNPGTLCMIPSATPTSSSTASSSATASSSLTPTNTPTASLSVGGSPSASPSQTAPVTVSKSISSTITLSSSATSSKTATSTLSSTATQTPSNTATATLSSTGTQTQTRTATPSNTWAPHPVGLSYLYGTSWSTPGSYTYTFWPFKNVSQGTVNAGSVYSGWMTTAPDTTCPSGIRNVAQLYTGGASAGGCMTTLPNQDRQSNVTFHCSSDGVTVELGQDTVEYPGACNYQVNFYVPCTGPFSPLCADASPSSTAAATPSATAVASATASGSASESAGASASSTPFSSTSAAGTPASTLAAAASASPTGSPWSSLPNRLRIQTSSNIPLNFVEVLAFSPAGLLLTVGATLEVSSVNSTTQAAALGTDLCCDPYDGPACAAYSSQGVNPTGDYYDVVFPGFAASAVASVYLVNRMEGGTVSSSRLVAANGHVVLFSPNGNMLFDGVSSSATVSMYNFVPYSAPVYPSPTDPNQVNAVILQTWVSYVNITAAPGQCLQFNEIFLLDATNTNVALKKNASASGQVTGSSAGAGVDGIIDMDNTGTANATASVSCSGSAWWSVALGGMYNVQTMILWNRYPAGSSATGAQLNGAVATFYNGYGLAVGVQQLSGAAVQTLPVALFYPSPTPTSSGTQTGTPSPSTTGTTTQTPSSTQTGTPSPSTTGTVTQTPTGTATPSGTTTPSSSETASTTASSTSSSSASLSNGETATSTSSITASPSSTASSSQTASRTASPSHTTTGTPTLSATATPTTTPSSTTTSTVTVSATISPTGTPTQSRTASVTPTQTGTSTQSPTKSVTSTPTSTPTPSGTATVTPTGSNTGTRTSTQTPSVTALHQPAWLYTLYSSTTLSCKAGSNTYTIPMFSGNAGQGATSMGTWNSLAQSYDPTCTSGFRLSGILYTGGASASACSTTNLPTGSTDRNAFVALNCTNPGTTTATCAYNTENPTCYYQLYATVNCASNPWQPGTLCTQPSATPTASLSAVVTRSSTSTGSTTPTLSNTPSATNTASSSKSAGASSSITSSASMTAVSTPSVTSSSTRTPTPTGTPVIVPAWLGYLYGNTYGDPAGANGYGYIVAPFVSVNQYAQSNDAMTLAGNYAGWNAPAVNTSCPSGFQLSSQLYNQGLYAGGCSTTLLGQQRTTILTYACSPAGVTSVANYAYESPACNYAVTMIVNCAGNPAKANTLCIPPSATATNSPTASLTPTNSPTLSTSISTSLTASSTPSPTASITYDVTTSPTLTPTQTPSYTATTTKTTTPTSTQTSTSTPTRSITPTPSNTPTQTSTQLMQPAWLYSAYSGSTISCPGSGYTFSFNLFGTSSQSGTNTGSYYSVGETYDFSCTSGWRLNTMTFAGGTSAGACSTANLPTNSNDRNMVVTLNCTTLPSTPAWCSYTAENPTCAYQMTGTVNCAANPWQPGTLCTQPSATPTQTPSASAVSTPSATPSNTPTLSNTPSATNTASPSESVGDSASATSVVTPSAAASQSASFTPPPTPTPTSTPLVVPSWLSYLNGNTYANAPGPNSNQFGYILTPYVSVVQYSTGDNQYNTGTYAAGFWNPPVANSACTSGYQLSSQQYNYGTGGGGCSTTLLGTQRTTYVNFTCGVGGVTAVSSFAFESPACRYSISLSVNCSLNTVQPGTLCVQASATQTPSSTLTPSRTPSNTPSSSRTASHTPTSSLTPSVTASITSTATGSASNSPSATGSASASLSLGASVSATPSTSGSASTTPSNTGSSSITPSYSMTASPSSTTTGSLTQTPVPTTTSSVSVTPTASQTPTQTPTATFTVVPAWMSIVGNANIPFYDTPSGNIYAIDPFHSVTQTTPVGVVNSLGYYNGWDALTGTTACPSGLLYNTQTYVGGTYSAACGGVLTAILQYTCSTNGYESVGTTITNTGCSYLFQVSISCVANGGTLCVAPTPTPTQSGTQTPSKTGTQTISPTITSTKTPSQTETSSASHSYGISPTGTSTPSKTPSNTPSASLTASATASVTASPLSPNPYKLRLATTTGNLQITISEIMAFTTTGQLVTPAVVDSAAFFEAGTAASAALATDFCLDPWNCALATGTAGVANYLEIDFPPAPGYPAGLPVPISTVYVINNAASSTELNLENDGAALQLFGANGVVQTQIINSGASVEQYTFAPMQSPLYPTDAWQGTPAALSLGVRFVRISGGSGQLNFRELFVFDVNYNNVVLNKPATSSGQRTGDPTAYTAAMGNNGVIDFDNSASGDMACSNATTGAWWQADLGGAYNVSSFAVFNRYLPAGTVENALASYTLYFLNAGGVTVASQTLASTSMQYYSVAMYAPTPSGSLTASITATRSLTSSSSSTATGSLTASITPSSSPTATVSPTASLSFGASGSPTNSPTASRTPSETPSSTGSLTGTATVTPTATATASLTPSSTATSSTTPSTTASVSPSFTPAPWYLANLYGQSYRVPAYDGHTYIVAPFVSVVQDTNALTLSAHDGTFNGWDTPVADPTCPTGLRLVTQNYTNGDACTGGYNGKRMAILNYTCSPTTDFVMSAAAFSPYVNESPTCFTRITVTVNCDLNGGTMCVPGPSPTSSLTASSTLSSSKTATSTRSGSQTRTETRTSSATSSGTSSSTATSSVSGSTSVSSSSSATASASLTASSSLTASASISGSSAATQSPTLTASRTRTETRSVTATSSMTPAPTATSSSSPSASASASDSVSNTPVPTATGSSSSSASSSSSTSGSGSISVTGTATRSAAHTASRSVSAARTHTPTQTGTPAETATPTLSGTSSVSATAPASQSAPVTHTSTGSGTPPATPSSTGSKTGSALPTASRTSSVMPSPSFTGSKTTTPTKTPSVTSTGSKSGTKTPTASKTATKTATGSKTATRSKTGTPTATRTHSGSRRPKAL